MKDALGSIQSVAILGATSDIGAAIARRLIDSRTRTVILGARETAGVGPLYEHMQSPTRTIQLMEFDALKFEGHAGFVEALFSGQEDIDVVVLSFGVLGSQQELVTDVDKSLELINTNYTATVSIGLRVANALKAQGHGALVFLSSVAAERPRRANFLYGSSKAGLDAFAQGLHDDLREAGVQVLVIRPGFVHTKMTKGLKAAPFSTDPETVAAAVVQGLRTGAHTVWVPPLLRWVMFAVRHLPRPIFRKLGL